MDQLVSNFCQLVRSRSKEHQSALQSLLRDGSFGIAVGLLRQELDSLIRVVYLYDHGPSTSVSLSLMEHSVAGEQWKRTTAKGKSVRITDREMMDLASQLGGWVEIIYSFGCKLIHLSDVHDYKAIDPFVKIFRSDKEEIINYLQRYHQYPDNDIDQCRFESYLPKVMQKLVDNVDFYVSELESANSA